MIHSHIIEIPPAQILRKAKTDSVLAGAAPGIASEHFSVQSSGQVLPIDVRSFFENRFQRDFSQVKIHADRQSAVSAQSMAAAAYTCGNHIVFNGGQYQPHNKAGQRLLAHELTHVMQQDALGNELIQRQALPGTERQSLSSPSLAEFLGYSVIDTFDFGQASLTSSHEQSLTQYASTVIALLRDHPGSIVQLTGHTDAPGETEDNDALGLQRAQAARQFLIDAGVPGAAILVLSAGELQPRVATETREARNRRVELRFVVNRISLPVPDSWSPPSPEGEPVTPPISTELPPSLRLPPDYDPDWQPGPRVIPGPTGLWRPVPPLQRQQDIWRDLSRVITGSMHRRDIARLAARTAAMLGLDEDEIRDMLDEAMIDGGVAGLRAALEAIVYGVAGQPSSPTGPYGPERSVPGEFILPIPIPAPDWF